jgi:tetraacyldisaccharide 4'-kinase
VSHWLWEHDSKGAQIARLSLAPAAWGVQMATAVRGAMYRSGWLRRRELPLPTISIGNLTVGGTGKTPLASWIAGWFISHGLTPAILLRGYGGDEAGVHRVNVPQAIVLENPDRAHAAGQAAAAGADVIVLDDGFQHLEVARDLDIVLLSAESLNGPLRSFPAGPWRERGDALARGDIGVVTRKSATIEQAHQTVRWMGERLRPGCRVAVAELRLGGFEGLRSGAAYPRSCVRGARVVAAAGIGDPRSFGAQLRALGARVDLRSFRDHHPYDAGDARRLARDGRDADYVVMTAKDAVKMRRLWPADAAEPLVGVLEVCWEDAEAEVERALNQVSWRRRATDAPGTNIRGGESRFHQ